MKVVSLHIPDVKLVYPSIFKDERGWFCETYSQERYAEEGIAASFVQDNQSLSKTKGVIRGLHCQAPPFAQGKLVRVIRGRILDVAVDIRLGSPTYGEYVSAELSAEEGVQIWVPEGFLHGFQTLEDNTEVAYKTTGYYNKKSEMSVRWDDEVLDINWKVVANDVMTSDKDSQAETFSEFVSPFKYSAN